MAIKTDSSAIAAFLAKGKTVTRLPAAGEAEAKEAARQQYLVLRGEPEVVVVEGPGMTAENRAEMEAEHFADCRAAGMTSDMAMSDWNYMNGNG